MTSKKGTFDELERLLNEKEFSSDFLLRKVEEAKEREFRGSLVDVYNIEFSYLHLNDCSRSFTSNLIVRKNKIYGAKRLNAYNVRLAKIENGSLIFNVDSNTKKVYLVDNFVTFFNDNKDYQLTVKVKKMLADISAIEKL